MEPPKPFPEMGSSMDPTKVPWIDAVVWSERAANGERIYEWVSKEHVRQASWTSGTVSIQIDDTSFIYNAVKYMLIQAPFITIGQNVRTG